MAPIFAFDSSQNLRLRLVNPSCLAFRPTLERGRPSKSANFCCLISPRNLDFVYALTSIFISFSVQRSLLRVSLLPILLLKTDLKPVGLRRPLALLVVPDHLGLVAIVDAEELGDLVADRFAASGEVVGI